MASLWKWMITMTHLVDSFGGRESFLSGLGSAMRYPHVMCISASALTGSAEKLTNLRSRDVLPTYTGDNNVLIIFYRRLPF